MNCKACNHYKNGICKPQEPIEDPTLYCELDTNNKRGMPHKYRAGNYGTKWGFR